MGIKENIQNLVDQNEVCLFMKGTPESPQCGFSMTVSNILKHLNVKFKGVNVLEDQNLRQEIKSFNYVILSQTLQAFLNPEKVLNELLRVGKKAIVTIPNFGYWKVRIDLLFKGTMPITENLPNEWYNTPNLHMCSIKDFVNFCNDRKLKLTKSISLSGKKVSYISKKNLNYKNFFSELGIFEIEK